MLNMKEIGTFVELKNLISMSPNLDNVLNYFFDMQDAGKLEASTSILPPFSVDIDKFFKVIEKIIGTYLNVKIRISKPMFQIIRQESIIHGVCKIGSDLPLLTVIFASDIKIGIIAMVQNGDTKLWRITLSEQPMVYQ